jgi:hypothetical protein
LSIYPLINYLEEDTGGATTPTPTVAYSTEDTGIGITASSQPLTASDPPLELLNNHIEPDSLMMTSAELDKGGKISKVVFIFVPYSKKISSYILRRTQKFEQISHFVTK